MRRTALKAPILALVLKISSMAREVIASVDFSSDGTANDDSDLHVPLIKIRMLDQMRLSSEGVVSVFLCALDVRMRMSQPLSSEELAPQAD